MIRDRLTYNSCSTLPMTNFVEVVSGNNLNALYKEGPHPFRRNVDLDRIWEAIIEEYRSLTNDDSVQDAFLLVRDYTFWSNKLDILRMVVDQVKLLGYRPELFDVLRKLGFRYQFTKESYLKDLQLVMNNAMSIVVKMDQYGKQIEEVQSKDQNTDGIDHHQITVTLERVYKISIDMSTCTVAKYIAYLNNAKNNG